MAKNKFSSTLLAQAPTPEEIQKADLDLLKKINEVQATLDSLTSVVDNLNASAAAPRSTAGIYDSGSNANGSWIRYTDGTMQCWGVGSFTGSISVNTVTGATVTWYHSNSQNQLFPKSFINSSAVVPWTCGQASYPSPYYTHSVTTDQFSYYVWSLQPGDPMTSGIKWTAFVKWK